MGPIFIPRGTPLVSRGLPDGLAVSATSDGICEWEIAGRAARRTVPFSNGVTPHAVSLSGDVFYAEEKALFVWRRATGARARLLTLPDAAPISISADGTHVACAVGAALAVTRLADGVEIARLPQPYSRFALAHGGRWVLFWQDESAQSGSGWTNYAVVETATGQGAGGGMLIGDDAVVGLSSDGLAVEYDGRQTGVDVLDPSTPRIHGPRAWPGARWTADAVPFAMAGPRALTWCGRQVLAIGEDRPVLTEHARVKGAALSPGGGWLALMLFDQQGLLISTTDPTQRTPFTVPSYPEAIAVLPDGRRLFGSRGAISWDDGKKVKIPSHPFAGLASSRDGGVLAVRSGRRGLLRGPLIVVRGDAVEEGPAVEAHCLALRPDGTLLAISTDAGIEVWDTAPLRKVRTIPAARALALAFAEDGLRLFALDADLTVRAFPD